MSWHYEPDGEFCRHEQSGIVAHWSGGQDRDGLLWRGFRFSHDEWECRLKYRVFENGIERFSTIGDLSKNEITSRTTIHPDASIRLDLFDAPEVLKGAPPMSAEFLALAQEAILCLYNQGGRFAIRLAPATSRRVGAH